MIMTTDKTGRLEQAALEYIAKNKKIRGEHTAFKEGAKFATQWISADEERPESGTDILVKIKAQNGHRITIDHYCTDYDGMVLTDRFFYNGNMVTHWKYIDYE